MGLLRKRRHGGRDGTTLFFATDLHGSEVCFRKFVSAASFYGADLLVLGGDITGKQLAPIVEQGGGNWWSELFGERHVLKTEELASFEARMADAGIYTRRMGPDEHADYERASEKVEGLFLEVMKERLARWVDYARERLDGTGVRIITAPGNDDPYEVDDVIRDRGGERVLLMEGETFEVAPGHEMLSTGWSNHTPWNTHREFDEDVLRHHIEAMASRLEHPAGALFNIHVPPYDTTIDTAPKLDEGLAVETSAGNQLTAPAGSRAVRAAIEAHQPLASLHGHVHESAGSVRIGRTVAVNPGSEYGEGVLRGALLTLGDGRLIRLQATTG